jgi:hypothetical protein
VDRTGDGEGTLLQMTDFMLSKNGEALRQGCVVQVRSDVKQYINMSALPQMPIYTQQE